MLTTILSALSAVTGALSSASSVWSYVKTTWTFLQQNWKYVLAVVILVGAFYQGWQLASKAHELREAKAQVETLKGRLATITLQQALDAKRASDDALKLQPLKQIVHDTPPNTAACLPRAAVSRVRRVQ